MPLQQALVKIAKKLKKNNVAVDVVSFGCEEEIAEKLEAFHSAVASNDNSHLVTVAPGTILSDMLFGTLCDHNAMAMRPYCQTCSLGKRWVSPHPAETWWHCHGCHSQKRQAACGLV
jgi:hypothetical protein